MMPLNDTALYVRKHTSRSEIHDRLISYCQKDVEITYRAWEAQEAARKARAKKRIQIILIGILVAAIWGLW